MKFSAYVFGAALMSLVSVGLSANAATAQNPVLVSIPAHSVFLPPGFDDNDNVQMVLETYLPNTCFKSAPAAVQVDYANKRIFFMAQAYQYMAPNCLELWTPDVRTVDLGILPQGNYGVYETDGKGNSALRGNMPVAAAKSSSPDDYLYAPITQASVDKSTGKAILNLQGVFGSDCVSMQQVVVMYRVPHVIEVLPIAQYNGGTCSQGNVPFNVNTALPAVDPGATLIHIRSLNGQSVNLVQDL